MEKTVFWSWQSDLDGRVTRELVRSALDFGDRFIATEDTFEYQATLTSIEPNALRMLAVDAFNELAEVYGHEPFTAHEIAEMAKF